MKNKVDTIKQISDTAKKLILAYRKDHSSMKYVPSSGTEVKKLEVVDVQKITADSFHVNVLISGVQHQTSTPSTYTYNFTNEKEKYVCFKVGNEFSIQILSSIRVKYKPWVNN